jgi:hypothetical protein
MIRFMGILSVFFRAGLPCVMAGSTKSLRWLMVMSTGRAGALVLQSAQNWRQLMGRVHNGPVG